MLVVMGQHIELPLMRRRDIMKSNKLTACSKLRITGPLRGETGDRWIRFKQDP